MVLFTKPKSALEVLIENEGWEIQGKHIKAFGYDFPICHPVAIWNKIYREETNHTVRMEAIRKIHDYYWPDEALTYHYWTERRFSAHVDNYSFISLAGGAGIGKSADAAKIAIIQQFSDPKNNACIVASTTLQSLSKRIWGYIVRYIHEIKVPIHPFFYTKSPSPQITFDRRDEIHSMSAMAAGVGTDEQAIKNYIGRHPKKKLMLILDEATDLSPSVLPAVANLEAGEDGKLQVWVIGNSNSKSDLHGALSTPLDGWDSVDRHQDTQWRTTQKNGICLYFPEWDSPAIHETDPIKKKALSKFLITQEQIDDKKAHYGENSVEYARFVAGFWLESGDGTQTFTTQPFLQNYQVQRRSLWSGLQPLRIVGGLDPAFSVGGDKAILRLAILGQTTSGQIVLDFRDKELLFQLKMLARHKDPIEVQLADQVIDILHKHKCLLEDVAVDCTGQGRTFAELIRLRAAQNKGIHWRSPIKVIAARTAATKANLDLMVKTPTDLWDNLKDFIQTNQICGLDDMAVYQLTTRLLIVNPKTKKRELEPKLDYRNRMNAINPGRGSSPDEADGASLCLFTAIHRHGFFKEQVKDITQVQDFFAQKYAAMQKAEMIEQQKAETFKGVKAGFNTDFDGTRKVKLPF